MCKLLHVAIATTEYEKYIKLFKQLGMKVERESGKIPERQLWFFEGIQLKEVENFDIGNNVDHIASVEKSIDIALLNGCTLDSDRSNWFILSNGTKIELMSEENSLIK